jgi:hypothetical protein
MMSLQDKQKPHRLRNKETEQKHCIASCFAGQVAELF